MSKLSKQDLNDPERAEKFCSRMAGTIRGLKSVLEKETAFVKKHNLKEITQLQGDKTRLSQTFQSDIVLLRNEAMTLSRLTPVPLTRLRRDLEGLEQIIAENARSLEAELAVAESVTKRIAQKATQMNAGPSTYGAGAEPPRARAHSAAAIAFDNKI